MSSNNVPQWNQQSLNNHCECYNCKQGITTLLHSESSHDQSLYQKLPYINHTIDIQGGTTKCARVFIQYCERVILALKQQQQTLTNNINTSNSNTIDTTNTVDDDIVQLVSGNNTIIELGSGTGLISIALQYSINKQQHIIATDQQPLLELLQYNIDNNKHNDNDIYVHELQWDDNNTIKQIIDITKQQDSENNNNRNNDNTTQQQHCYTYIIGSDLIYAKEGISPLVDTYISLSQQYTNGICYLVYISRFEWETNFFTLMSDKGKFNSKCVYTYQDIQLWKFTKSTT